VQLIGRGTRYVDMPSFANASSVQIQLALLAMVRFAATHPSWTAYRLTLVSIAADDSLL
jgi:hypothetical protein